MVEDARARQTERSTASARANHLLCGVVAISRINLGEDDGYVVGPVGQPPDLGNRVAGRHTKLVEQFPCSSRIPCQEVGRRVGSEGDRGEGRSKPIPGVSGAFRSSISGTAPHA
jgi:hypothetical protein